MTNWRTFFAQETGKTVIYYNDQLVGELELPDKNAFMDLKRRLR